MERHGLKPPRARTPGVVFLYNTREALWAGMASSLYSATGAIRDALEVSEREIARRLGWSLKRELSRYVDDATLHAAEHALEPVLTAVQIALTDGWRERGVHPDAAAGRSGGEFAAGYARGDLSHGQAIELACRASRLLQEVSGSGRIVAVSLAVEKTEALQRSTPAPFHVVADGWTDTTIIGCATSDLEPILQFMSASGVKCRVVPGTAAPHSHLIDSCQSEFIKPLPLGDIVGQSPIPGYSATTGNLIGELPRDTTYWWNAIRQPLMIHRMIQTMLADGYRVFLEVGANPSLAPPLHDLAAATGQHVVTIASMRRHTDLQMVMDESLDALRQLGLADTEPKRSVQWGSPRP